MHPDKIKDLCKYRITYKTNGHDTLAIVAKKDLEDFIKQRKIGNYDAEEICLTDKQIEIYEKYIK